MKDNIERIDQKRRKILGTYVVGAIVFFGAWIVRFILKETGILNDPLDYAIAVPFAIGLVILLYSFGALIRVNKEIKTNPALQETLNDERVQLNTLLAFKYGFFAMLAGLAFFAVFNLFFPIKDTRSVFFGLLMVGAFSYNLKFYRLEKD